MTMPQLRGRSGAAAGGVSQRRVAAKVSIIGFLTENKGKLSINRESIA